MNLADRVGAYSSNDCQGVYLCSIRERASNRPHPLRRQHGIGVLFASQINKASSPSMPRILLNRHPLKVFNPVVRFDAVDVVDVIPINVARHERKRNQPMNVQWTSALVSLHAASHVPVVMQSRRNFSRLKLVGLRTPPPANPSDGICRGSDSSVSCNFHVRKPRNRMPFLVCVHAKNYTGLWAHVQSLPPRSGRRTFYP